MKTELIELFEKNSALHAETHRTLRAIRAELESLSAKGMGELAETALVAAEIRKLVDDTSGECGVLRRECEQMACMMWIQSGSNGPIRTEYVTASADIKMQAKLPDRRIDPAGFARLMEHLQVPRELWDVPVECSAAVQPHWPGMLEYISTLIGTGRPLPPGVDATTLYPIYKLILRARKELSGNLGLVKT